MTDTEWYSIIKEELFKFKDDIITIKTDVVEIKAGMTLVVSSIDTLSKMVDKHEKILFGNPESMGESGLIMTVKALSENDKTLKNEIKSVRNTFSIFWTSVLTFLNIVINIIIKR